MVHSTNIHTKQWTRDLVGSEMGWEVGHALGRLPARWPGGTQFELVAGLFGRRDHPTDVQSVEEGPGYLMIHAIVSAFRPDSSRT